MQLTSPRQPTCWEYFGFPGPTNKQNLDLMRREREYSVLGMFQAMLNEKYLECLREIDGPPPAD